MDRKDSWPAWLRDEAYSVPYLDFDYFVLVLEDLRPEFNSDGGIVLLLKFSLRVVEEQAGFPDA